MTLTESVFTVPTPKIAKEVGIPTRVFRPGIDDPIDHPNPLHQAIALLLAMKSARDQGPIKAIALSGATFLAAVVMGCPSRSMRSIIKLETTLLNCLMRFFRSPVGG